MPQVDLSFAQDPNTLMLALICGMIPAVVWLVYWLRENSARPRDTAALLYVFIGGALMVLPTYPVEKFIYGLTSNNTALTIMWAASEELLKFAIFAVIILRTSSRIRSPIDYAIYLIVVALGFAGFENALYFLQPLQTGSTSVLILAGSMRFLGTTLMHAMASSLSGIGLGLAFFKSKKAKIAGAVGGLALAVAFHSSFNLLVEAEQSQNFLIVFALLWIATIVILMLFEKLRRLGSTEVLTEKKTQESRKTTELLASLMSSGSILPADTLPIADGLKAKGIVPKAGEYGELSRFLDALRGEYTKYLMNFGTDEAKARETAHTLVPNTISAKSALGIMDVLKREEAREQGPKV